MSTTDRDIPWGPTGELVYRRTYSRMKADGTQETWPETVERVATGNLGLVYGPPAAWDDAVRAEHDELVDAMLHFRLLPAGRHLWASGVPGRQFLMNCFADGWDRDDVASHPAFMFMRLMEGGGVGANYGSQWTSDYYGPPRRPVEVRIIMDRSHPDYERAREAVVLMPPVQAQAGQGAVALRVADSREGWAQALTTLLRVAWSDDHRTEADGLVYPRPAIVVFDVSDVRPEGSPLKTFGGTASGPIPLARMLLAVGDIVTRAYQRQEITPLDFMSIDHATATCVVAGGVRRSARMSILPWDDPYIFDFIAAKAADGDHWSTNISVAIDDRFLDALNGVGTPDMVEHAGRVHRAVVEGMLTNGEPGYWNRTLSNVGELRPVETTNPCGEIPLESWEACNLGHVNLEAFADRPVAELLRAHQLMARFLIRATFGNVADEKQAEVQGRNRRIGVGHLGVQGYLVKRGVRYSEAPKDEPFLALLNTCRYVVRNEARAYAFQLRIPEPIKVTTVAPTGSVAKLPGASEGIHPIYAKHFIRRVRFSTLRQSERDQIAEYVTQGYDVEPDLNAANTLVVSIPTKERLVQAVEQLGLDPDDLVEDVSELTLPQLLSFQAMYQEHYADNAVSFTANVAPGRYSVDEVEDILRRFLPRLKGVTLMVDGTRPQAPYERIDAETYQRKAERVGIEAVDDAFDENCASGACPIK